MKKRNKVMTKPIPSVSALARLLGRPRTTVQSYLSDPRWSFSGPPWASSSLPLIHAWADVRREGRERTPDEKRARLAVLQERAKKLRLEREILAGQYQDREEVEEERLASIYETRARLLHLKRALAANLQGKPPDQFEEAIDAAVRQCLSAFTDNMPLAPCPKCGYTGDATATPDGTPLRSP